MFSVVRLSRGCECDRAGVLLRILSFGEWVELIAAERRQRV